MTAATLTPERQKARPTPRVPLRVGYLVSRFPKLSETFVLYEALALRELDVDVAIYPLKHERETVAHPDVARLRGRVHQPRRRALAAARALAHYARRRPRALVGAVWDATRGSWGRRRTLTGSLATLPLAVEMAYAMEQTGVEHAHAHFASHATTAALVVRRLTGIPFRFTAHAHDIYVDQRLLREKVAEASFVVTISEFNRALIARYAEPADMPKVRVLHCGVDTALFAPPADRAAREELRIVCVGSLEEKKGQRFLLDACALLRERGVPFECVLVGGGASREALERQIVERELDASVRLLGPQPRDTVLELVRDADVVVLPSIVTSSGKMEGIPVALMEALACARPVVATRISGVPELVVDGETGLLVPQRDAPALADALARLHAEPELGARLGAAGRELVLREFDLRTNAAALHALIAEELGA
jgi:glycosyltransferase involved in cell wall biosynthesis